MRVIPLGLEIFIKDKEKSWASIVICGILDLLQNKITMHLLLNDLTQCYKKEHF